jgi:transcriptional regulator with XRE-family HTH domain
VTCKALAKSAYIPCEHASRLADVTPQRRSDPALVAFLKAAMEAARIPTGAHLAELSGINPSLVNRWLNGKTVPSIDGLRAIAEPLGLEPRELWVRAGYMTRSEVGLGDDPVPPTGKHSVEDEIRADGRIRDDRKEPLIALLESLREEYSDDRTDERDGRSA